ncbi:sulfotransferase domain-containing protein [Paenibacillus sp. IB182496]|uniref:Sulfotransferase domain-containing protein n=1 Tax=Paenibacillus sabuli TaxID=2772509 RepID=A0A927BQF4_9BACL|nr:sulfotransferase domain-containing protein [Paenibacillus sabuli]MBD2843608.1 sulfotransferase domain-containing protein [Paenibacillus sabuli]
MSTHPVLPLPPFISSSVPKSGTHMMQQLLNGIPHVNNRIENLQTKFFVNNPPVGFYEDHARRLSLLQPNQFGIGHLYYSDRYARMLEERGLKHIFLYRDPRDILVSLTYFIASKWVEHPLHPYFKTRYVTFQDRALALLQGTPEFPATFGQYFTPFYGWLDDSRCLHVSFEQLMVTPAKRRETLLRILRFLWADAPLPASLSAMAGSMNARIDSSSSRTFRAGRIGAWRTEFTPRIKALFQQDAGHLVVKAGYERSTQW